MVKKNRMYLDICNPEFMDREYLRWRDSGGKFQSEIEKERYEQDKKTRDIPKARG